MQDALYHKTGTGPNGSVMALRLAIAPQTSSGLSSGSFVKSAHPVNQRVDPFLSLSQSPRQPPSRTATRKARPALKDPTFNAFCHSDGDIRAISQVTLILIRLVESHSTIIKLHSAREPPHHPLQIFAVMHLLHDLPSDHTQFRVRAKSGRVPVFTILTDTIKINEQYTALTFR